MTASFKTARSFVAGPFDQPVRATADFSETGTKEGIILLAGTDGCNDIAKKRADAWARGPR